MRIVSIFVVYITTTLEVQKAARKQRSKALLCFNRRIFNPRFFNAIIELFTYYDHNSALVSL